MIIRIIIYFSILFVLAGCKQIECGKFSEIIDSNSKKDELTKWADRNVFRKTFDSSGYNQLGKLSGPGLRGSFRKDSLTDGLPIWLHGYEVRPLGSNLIRPEGIFIGSSSFRGIVVAREDMLDLFITARFSESGFAKIDGRIAVMCGDRRD